MTMTIAYQTGAQAQREGVPHTRPLYGQDTAVAKSNRQQWYSGWYDSYFAHKFGEPWRSDLRANGVE